MSYTLYIVPKSILYTRSPCFSRSLAAPARRAEHRKQSPRGGARFTCEETRTGSSQPRHNRFAEECLQSTQAGQPRGAYPTIKRKRKFPDRKNWTSKGNTRSGGLAVGLFAREVAGTGIRALAGEGDGGRVAVHLLTRAALQIQAREYGAEST